MNIERKYRINVHRTNERILFQRVRSCIWHYKNVHHTERTRTNLRNRKQHRNDDGEISNRQPLRPYRMVDCLSPHRFDHLQPIARNYVRISLCSKPPILSSVWSISMEPHPCRFSLLQMTTNRPVHWWSLDWDLDRCDSCHFPWDREIYLDAAYVRHCLIPFFVALNDLKIFPTPLRLRENYQKLDTNWSLQMNYQVCLLKTIEPVVRRWWADCFEFAHLFDVWACAVWPTA